MPQAAKAPREETDAAEGSTRRVCKGPVGGLSAGALGVSENSKCTPALRLLKESAG